MKRNVCEGPGLNNFLAHSPVDVKLEVLKLDFIFFNAAYHYFVPFNVLSTTMHTIDLDF